MFRKTLSLMAVVTAVAVSLPLAQAGGGGGPGGGGPGGGGPGGGGFGGGGPGGFGGFTVDPAAQIQSSLARIQTALQIPAGDEWTVLSAKIQKVLEDQQKLAVGAANPLQAGRAGGGGFGGGGPGGGPGGGRGGMGGPPAAAPDPANPLAVARDDLSKALAAGPSTDTPTTADADLKTKMTAVRDHRKKLEEQLKNDQANLQKLVTIRQEAILLNLGVLE